MYQCLWWVKFRYMSAFGNYGDIYICRLISSPICVLDPYLTVRRREGVRDNACTQTSQSHHISHATATRRVRIHLHKTGNPFAPWQPESLEWLAEWVLVDDQRDYRVVASAPLCSRSCFMRIWTSLLYSDGNSPDYECRNRRCRCGRSGRWWIGNAWYSCWIKCNDTTTPYA